MKLKTRQQVAHLALLAYFKILIDACHNSMAHPVYTITDDQDPNPGYRS